MTTIRSIASRALQSAAADKLLGKCMEAVEKIAVGGAGGVGARARGEFDEARTVWARARDLYGQIGMPHRVEKIQGWIDSLPGADGCG